MLLFLRLFAVFGSGASLVSVILTLNPPSAGYSLFQASFIVVGIAFTIIAFVAEIYAFLIGRPKPLRSVRRIRNYMFNWIKDGGSVCVFSNDLSWVNDAEMIKMLERKAGRHELRICVPKMIPVADQLRTAGAVVHIYPALKYVPKSRFTVINLGRADAQVAIGRRIGRVHCVEEFAEASHPAFSMAHDLVEIIERLNTNEHEKSNANPGSSG